MAEPKPRGEEPREPRGEEPIEPRGSPREGARLNCKKSDNTEKVNVSAFKNTTDSKK